MRYDQDGARRRGGTAAAANALSASLPATQEEGERQRRQVAVGWELLLGPDQSEEGRRRANLLLTAWGGQEQVCPLGLYWALTRNSLVGASCRARCCAGMVTGQPALPCSLKGDWASLQVLPQGIAGVGPAEALFDGPIELGRWRSLARNRRQERKGVKRPMPDPAAAMATEPDVAPPTPSAREQRFRGKGVEDEDEDEEAGGVGALRGAGFARAEGFAVRDVAHDALDADVPHAEDVLGQGTDAL